MEIAGYIASLLIGISLGLIGGGGSILTVPVMVYLFGLQPILATSYSLFIVGSASLVGAFKNARRGQVNKRAVMVFGITSILVVFITRKFLLPAIPKNLFTINGFTITGSLLIMLLFAILMLVASISMIRTHMVVTGTNDRETHSHTGQLTLYGIFIGLVTGLLGAGGGFLLIPVLVLLLKLPMKSAIGTSLSIIALNSLIGFTGDLGHYSIDWKFLIIITGIAIAGIFMGSQLSKKIEGEKLKKGFGWFVLIMGIYIIVKETILK